MKIEALANELSICKFKNLPQFDFANDFYFIAKTDEEISLVCDSKLVPNNVNEREDGWKALRIQGEIAFSVIGVISKLSALLAENEIGIFVVSTYNTDYILVKMGDFESAINLLNANGYEIKR